MDALKLSVVGDVESADADLCFQKNERSAECVELKLL